MASIKRVTALLFAVYSIGAANAATYYISPDGSDSASGLSPEQAWQTASRAGQIKLSAGDRILFERGRTFEGPLRFDELDRGTAKNPIVAGCFGPEEKARPQILGGRGRGIDVYSTTGLTIRDLIVTGDGMNLNAESGIVVHTSNKAGAGHITIERVEVSGFGEHGISIGAWKTTKGYRHVRIAHCTLHDNLRTGILTWGPWGTGTYAHSDIHIEHCRAYRMKGGSGITLSSVDGGVVERSVAHHNGREFSGAAGIWAWDSNDILFQFNESHDNMTTGADGDGFDFDGGVTNSVMQYNYSHDNDAAGFLVAQYCNAPPMRNIVIRFNISENDCRKKGYGAIHVWNGDGEDRVSGIQIYNNTVFLSSSDGDVPSAFAVISPTGSILAANNLFMTTGGTPLASVVSGQKGLTLRNNAYWPCGAQFRVAWKDEVYRSLSSWLAAAKEQERHGSKIVAFDADPLIKDPGSVGCLLEADPVTALVPYMLMAESPLLRKGLDLVEEYGIDTGVRCFFGTPISTRSQLAIGAHIRGDQPQ